MMEPDDRLIDGLAEWYAHGQTRRALLAGGGIPTGEDIAAAVGAVLRALRHAGLDGEVATSGTTLLDVAPQETIRGAKGYPERSAQHHALWALLFLNQVKSEPLAAGRHLAHARQCADLALAAPVAEMVAGGIKSAQEVRLDDGTIGLRIPGYGSRYFEVDLDGEDVLPGAFDDVTEQWAADERPRLLFEHGFDPAIGYRPIGWAESVSVDDTGLFLCGFVPREPDPRRFPRFSAARQRQAEVYEGIKGGAIRGYSVRGVQLNRGTSIKRWALDEVSITSTPCLRSARFTLRPAATM